MRSPALAPVASVALALILSALAGCQHHIQSICRQSCECEPCTDADLDDCIERGTAAEEEAKKKKDCSAKLDAYLGCVDDNLSCQQGARPGTDACSKEEQALVACTGTGNPFATPCQQATQKFSSCSGQPVPMGADDTCPPQQECQSKCVLAASCEEILGGAPSQTFQSCINACFSM